MNKIEIRAMKLTLPFLALLALAPFTTAHATEFIWKDPKTGASIIFPDTWRTINNQKPDDILTIIGPSQRDTPTCRLRARDDKRFTYYPVEFSSDVQRVAYNHDFIQKYLGEYDNVTITEYHDDAGLGRAFAGHAMATFTNATPRTKTPRMAQIWAGVYNGTAYIFDCSATVAGFAAWQPLFAQIASTIDMPKVIHEFPMGNYR
jgi:hypothetical protein